MRKVELRMKEQHKYDVIKRAAFKEISIRRAAVTLRCTIRTVYNLIKSYKTNGKDAFVHGNRNRKPITTIDKKLKDKIIKLYTDKYYMANFKHFQELLLKNEGISISYCPLYNLLMTAGFISPKCNRVTVRQANKRIQKKLDGNEQLTQAEQNHIAYTNLQDYSVSHPRKPRAKYFGELLQMDASEHVWFGTCKSHLHLALDDSTGMIVGAYFAPQETLRGYYEIFYQILTLYGIPARFLTDNRTVFEYNNLKNPSDEKDTFTQFGYACHLLGVELSTTSVPQKKGRVERVFGTLQDRLITELKLAGISDIGEANSFLKSYLLEFNKRFSLPTNYTPSVFDTQIDSEKINQTLAIHTTRSIDNGNTIRYKNKTYHLYDSSKMMLFKPKTKCMVLEAFNGELLASVNDEVYTLVELEIKHKYSKTFDYDIPKEKKYYGHKPKPDHPWTYQSFKQRQKRRKYSHSY